MKCIIQKNREPRGSTTGGGKCKCGLGDSSRDARIVRDKALSEERGYMVKREVPSAFNTGPRAMGGC